MNMVSLIAALAAVISGYGVIRHARTVMHNGVGFSDGGGWTVILLVETMFFLVAINVAVY